MILLIIAACVGLVALGGFILMLLWNWIMPYLFGLPTIGFWMALGIAFLVSMLFGGIKIKTK